MGLFIDLSKAFDLVDHDILLQKLSTMGIRGVALSWFKSYLSNREQIVKIESFDKRTRIASMNHSGRKFVRFGVPQGSILGPILFSLYVNDLGTNITTGNTVLYADDTSIFIQGDNICTLQFLIKDTFNQLLEWFEENRLIVNNDKTEAVLFHHVQNKNINIQTIRLGGKLVECSNETKFLGVHLDKHLNWSTHN